jgi:hypothetical protein
MCCHDDSHCDNYACNTTSFSCYMSCLDSNLNDDDSRCSSLGALHCDRGWCYADMADGERWCNEHSDCVSNYCDLSKGICSSGDNSCISDNDCNGLKCMVEQGYYCVTTCQQEGVDTDALCASGYVCQDGSCVPNLLDNGASCTGNGNCESGNCQNGVCCASGACCSSAEDCLQDLLCRTPSCSEDHQCVYTPIPCAQEDTELGDTCTGSSRCDGYGSCVAISTCEGGQGTEEYVCDQGSVAQVCI